MWDTSICLERFICLYAFTLLGDGGTKRLTSLFEMMNECQWASTLYFKIFVAVVQVNITLIFKFFFQVSQTFKKKLFIVSLLLRQQVHLMLKMAYGSCKKWLNSPVSNRKSNSYLLVLSKLFPIHSLAGLSWQLDQHNLGWTYPNTKQGYVRYVCDLLLSLLRKPKFYSTGTISRWPTRGWPIDYSG